MRITVGVSGGIAAYKAAELVRELQRKALEVHVVMTEAATRFVQPLTFSALTGHRVITSVFDEGGAPMELIDEAQWAEAFVVAPATANVLAKFAHGIAEDFLTTMYLATKAPVLVAPAMNVNMWEHPATQANVEILRQRGVRVIDPGTGDLACGMVGSGRMAEPEAIVEAVLNTLGHRHDLGGETVLITAGGTREALDPVRFLGNRSSGKMGYAVAEACRDLGAEVEVVPTDVTDPEAVERLGEAARQRFGHVDAWINGVGVGAVGRFDEVPLPLHRRVIEANLMGHLHGAWVALRLAVDSRPETVSGDRADATTRLKSLSLREKQVLDGLLAGQANKAIAFDLGLSPRTVEVHRANVMTKMGVSSLSSLVRIALLAESG